MIKKSSFVVLIILLLSMTCVAFQKAWSELSIYQGDLAFNENDFRKALFFYNQAKKSHEKNPYWIEKSGIVARLQGLRTGKSAWFAIASKRFEALAQMTLFYGRAWYYSAECELKSFPKSKKISPAQWEKIETKLKKALSYEPFNPWLQFQTAKLFLEFGPQSKQNENDSIELITSSIREHQPPQSSYYLPKVSPYLRPGYSALLNRSEGYLKKITPDDFMSYREMLRFIDKNELWSLREEAQQKYLTLANDFYKKKCDQGAELLKRKKYQAAYYHFRKAFWMQSWSYQRAKAGLLGAEAAMHRLQTGKHSVLNQEIHEILRSVLLENNEDMSREIPFLEPYVRQINDPFLSGIYYFRTKNYELTKQELQSIPMRDVYGKHFLVHAFIKTGDRSSAFEILKEMLNEDNPRIDDLKLLASIDNSFRLKVREKQLALQSINGKAQNWWADKSVNKEGELKETKTMQIFLEGNEKHLKINARLAHIPKKSGSYLIFLLDEKELGGIWLKDKKNSQKLIPIDVKSGFYFLKCIALQGSFKKDPNQNFIILEDVVREN